MSDVHPGQPQGLAPLDEPGDAELISAVRGGDLDAYGKLFERHVESARRLARQLVSVGDVDDLVSDAFAKVLSVLQRGGGPDLAFRAYLLTSLRRLHVDKLRAGARLTTTDDMAAYDPGVPFEDTAVAGFDNAAAAKAFASLPERWQQVLWHTEVEGQKPAEIAPLLGISANSVSALAYRAREGLRQAFISMHAQEAVEDACATTRANLGAYLRGGISRRDGAKVEDHLGSCRECSAIYLELAEVNNDLGAVLAPLLLGGAGAGYLAAAHVAAVGAAKGGVLFFLGRARDWVLHNPIGRVTAGATGAATAAAVVAAVALAQGGSEPVATRHTPASAPPAPAAPSSPAANKPSKPKPKQTPPPAVPAQVAPILTPPAPTPPPAKTSPVIQTPLAPISMSSAGPVTIDLTKGASDPNGDPLKVVSAKVKKPSHGKVKVDRGSSSSARQIVGRPLTDVVAARRADGGPTSVTYTPDPGWRGSDTITYVLGDGHGGTVAGTVKVKTPNTPPVANTDTASAPASWLGSTPTPIDVLANDTDANGDALTVTKVTAPAHGTAVISGNAAVYTPRVGYTGADSFRYVISDGHGGAATGTVTVKVGNLPDRAPIAHDDATTAAGAWSAPAPVRTDVLANDTDPDGDQLNVVSATGALHGSTAIDRADIVYTPDAGFTGEESIVYTISDGRGLTSSATLNITVGALPDRAPTAKDTSVSTDYQMSTTVDLAKLSSDPDGDRLTYSLGSQAAHGMASVPAGGLATYTPDEGFDGTDSFTYTVDDGRGNTATGTVHVSVKQPASDLTLVNTPAVVSGYEHIKLSADGIPTGRTATFTLHISGITGWHSGATHELKNIEQTHDCTLPDSPSGTLTLTCTVTGNGEITHLDFDVASGWSVDASVAPIGFTDSNSNDNDFQDRATTAAPSSLVDTVLGLVGQ